MDLRVVPMRVSVRTGRHHVVVMPVMRVVVRMRVVVHEFRVHVLVGVLLRQV